MLQLVRSTRNDLRAFRVGAGEELEEVGWFFVFWIQWNVERLHKEKHRKRVLQESLRRCRRAPGTVYDRLVLRGFRMF